MTSWIKEKADLRHLGYLIVALLCSVLFEGDAPGAGLAQAIEAKSLPEATVEVIDPESGQSGGTGTVFDVKLEQGDIILFRFSFTPAPDKRNRSIQSYLTDYIPPNTSVVGVRIIDEDGVTIEPRYPGLARDGCEGGSNCNSFSGLPCSSGAGCSGGEVDLASGSVAQVHADTGVFFVDRGDPNAGLFDRNPNDVFLDMENGFVMNPEPNNIDPQLTPLLEASAPYHAHNEWDWIQVQAFGISTAPGAPGGDGNTPHLYGSPVAGPETHYPFMASSGGVNGSGDTITHDVEFNDEDGPWRRIVYPGAKIGTGSSVTGSGHPFLRAIRDPAKDAPGQDPQVNEIGQDVTPANPADAAAVRWALGDARTGLPQFVEVALRVDEIPLDPNFFGGPGEHVNCGEVVGSDLSQRRSGVNDGENNPWPSYIGNPACVFLRLKLDVKADTEFATGSTPIQFETFAKNLAVETETGVVIYQQFSENRLEYVDGTSTPPPDSEDPASCPAPLDTSKSCLQWTVGTLEPSEEFEISNTFKPKGSGGTTGNLTAVYTSNELDIPYSTRDLVVITPIAVPELELAPEEPATLTAANPGEDYDLGDFESHTDTALGRLENIGNNGMNVAELNPVLPEGWSLVNDEIFLGTSSVDCAPSGSSTPTCTPATTLAPGEERSLSFRVAVPDPLPAGQDFTLQPIDMQLWHDETGFGGQVETYFPKAAMVPVGAVRTEKPTVDCDIGSTNTQITGTTPDPDADVTVFFNLIPRGFAPSDGTTEWVVDDFDHFVTNEHPVFGFLQPFGTLYGGLEVRAQAQADQLLPSELSDPCEGGVDARRECSDGLDNDGDGLFDFPADPGCSSLIDNDESDEPECSDGLDNDGDDLIDWPADPECADPFDDSEGGSPACSDGEDNDGDGDVDADDTDCLDSSGDYDPSRVSEAPLKECQNRGDDDGDCPGDTNGDSLTCGPGDEGVDFGHDPGCHADFDDDETDIGLTPEALKARLLVVFDTSGSMHFNTCTDHTVSGDECEVCDNSEEFLGQDLSCAQLENEFGCDPSATPTPAAFSLCDNGVADDTRLAQVKAGLSDVIANFGDVEWGLMRFKQRPVLFQPPSTNQSGPSGGWQGAFDSPIDDSVPPEDQPEACQEFNEGELLVSFDFDNAQTILDWMDGSTNYPDGLPPPLLDQELRGSGTTPLGGALQTAQEELSGVIADDDREACRPYRVILVTDGLETCGGDPAAEAATLEANGVPVVVIGFATPDPDVQSALDSIAVAGGQDGAIFVDDQQELASAFAEIVEETQVFETCNGLDDDCDGSVDEAFLPPLQPGDSTGLPTCDVADPTQDVDGCVHPDCDNAEGDCPIHPTCSNNLKGVCEASGYLVCSGPFGTTCDAPIIAPNCDPVTQGESCVDPQCNGLDDDCDGKVDEGLDCSCLSFELCNGVDDDCDGAIDEDAVGVGDECGSDIGVCEFGAVECVDPDGDPTTADSELQCVGGSGPEASDPCDGLDNDCDTLIDEDPGPACYDVGDEGCTDNGDGTFSCNGFCSPGVRECVDPDDDPSTANSELGACVGEVGGESEVCDGVDNDCDGVIDDPWLLDPNDNSIGDPCDNGDVGACFATGEYICDPQDPTSEELVCNAPEISSGTEVCNSVDDDCDGSVDEELGPPVGDACDTTASCQGGTLECGDHDDDPETPNTIECVGAEGGTEEVCNGADDNCNGEIDEFLGGDPCYPEELDGCAPDGSGGFACEGECAPGETVCVPPEILCQDFTGPASSDTCNGLDDDCDGNVDEGATCPGEGETCLEGECVFPCEMDEFPCPFGFYCEELGDETCDSPPCRFCVPDPCKDVTCDPGFACNSSTGECEDLCEGVECSEGRTCVSGLCLDCFDPRLACGDCEVCTANSDGVGECVTDLCCDVECEEGEFCRMGECVAQTCDPECGEEETCLDGECVSDPCASVECPEDQVCNPSEGMCMTDLCTDVRCPNGQACNPGNGMCIDDPCGQVTCPEGLECEVGFDGEGRCVAEEEQGPKEDKVYAGGGGCSTGGGGAPLWPLLLLLGLLWRRRGDRR